MNHKPKFISSSITYFMFYILVTLFCYIIHLFSTLGIFAVFGFFVFIPTMLLFILAIIIVAIAMGLVNSGLFYLKNNSEEEIRTFYIFLVSSAILIFVLFLPINFGFIEFDMGIVLLFIGLGLVTNIISINVALVNSVLEEES